jgi:hypothetical protein
MESRFGHDFSAVRAHADPGAAASARELGAAAYTVGQHIVFGAGRYQPETPSDEQLIAHELTHVVQTTRAGAHGIPLLTGPGIRPSARRTRSVPPSLAVTPWFRAGGRRRR